MDVQYAAELQKVMRGETSEVIPLKKLLLFMRSNHEVAFPLTRPLAQFARNVIQRQVIASGEITFVLQYLSLAVSLDSELPDVLGLLEVVESSDFSMLTDNGKTALYYLLNNIICLIFDWKTQEFEEFNAVELRPSTLMFLCENDVSGLEEGILHKIFMSSRFMPSFSSFMATSDVLQQCMISNRKFALNKIEFAIEAVCMLLGVQYQEIRLPELKIPIADRNGVFATDDDLKVFATQRQYIVRFTEGLNGFLQLCSEAEFGFVLSALQMIEQQSSFLDNAFDKKIALESGSASICLLLLLVGLKFEPQIAGRFSSCGFGVTENGNAPELRISLLYTIQNVVYQNPIGLEWLGRMGFFEQILVHELGDGETIGCAEIVSLLLSSCKSCTTCVSAIQHFLSEPANEHQKETQSQ